MLKILNTEERKYINICAYSKEYVNINKIMHYASQ